MATLTEERLDTALGKVQLFRAGDGPPLVYLHSAGGEPTHAALEDLADDHAVVRRGLRMVLDAGMVAVQGRKNGTQKLAHVRLLSLVTAVNGLA